MYALDSVQTRLDLAHSLGAESFNYQVQGDEIHEKIKTSTEGRGVDVVVGMSMVIRKSSRLILARGRRIERGPQIGLRHAKAMGCNLFHWGT